MDAQLRNTDDTLAPFDTALSYRNAYFPPAH